jgi:hypothetical protein
MATNTYVALDKVTVGIATPSITFTSINQGYTDLFIEANIQQVVNGEDVAIQFNSDTGSNYSRTYLCGDGSNAHSGRSSNATYMVLDHHATPPTADSFSVNLINVQNYSNTTTNKTVIARANSLSSFAGTAAVTGLWRSTAAITSVTIFCTNGSNIKAGSTFSLYGIVAASATSPKATGGTIYSDEDYYYHAFGSSGTFTPNQSLTCDYLVVAGGGGGGKHQGGGGGAGGLRSTVSATGGGGSLETALSLSASPYTVTIGSGGAGTSTSNTAGLQGTNSVFSTITSTGGGGGGYYNTNTATSGGSGGGASGGQTAKTPGTETANQGFAGGVGNTDGSGSGGGGGGAGAIGGTVINGISAGNGGNGVAIIMQGDLTYYAGGGGGGRQHNGSGGGFGGLGGGGTGAQGDNQTAGSGTANTGGGGGGETQSNGTSGNGGSGIVIVRYLKA